MNRKQRRVIWGAIALLFLALLIPPWESASLIHVFRGYALLFSTEDQYGAPVFLIERRSGLHVSVSLLLVEALFISLAAAGAVAALKKNMPEDGEAIGPQRESEPEQRRSEPHQESPDKSVSATPTVPNERKLNLNAPNARGIADPPSRLRRIPPRPVRVFKWVPTGLGALGLAVALLGSFLAEGGTVNHDLGRFLEIGGCLLALPLIASLLVAGWRLFVRHLIED